MSKPKKEWEFVSCRMERSAYEKLEDISIQTGLTKTKILEWAVNRYYEDLMHSRDDSSDPLGLYKVE